MTAGISLSAAHPALAKPKSNITGEVKLILEDGKELGCARKTIYAIPATKKLTAQVEYRFGNDFPVFYPLGIDFVGHTENEKKKKKHQFRVATVRGNKRTKRTKCNNAGMFSFKNLKAGEWYIYSTTKTVDRREYGTGEVASISTGAGPGANSSTGFTPTTTTTYYKGGTLVSKITVDGLAPIHVIPSHDERD